VCVCKKEGERERKENKGLDKQNVIIKERTVLWDRSTNGGFEQNIGFGVNSIKQKEIRIKNKV